jgi:hypothetical protein
MILLRFMDDKKKLLELSAKYIDDYLEPFLNDGKTSDIATYYPENPLININPIFRNLSDDKPEKIDKIQTRYFQIMNSIIKTPMRSILEQVCLMDNTLVIDVGSRVGERFGLFVAKKNPTSQVYVFNPYLEKKHIDNDVLLESLEKNNNYDSKFYDMIDLGNLSVSINSFYERENLENIQFKEHFFSKEKLEEIKKQNPTKRIIIHSHRTPIIPNDITYDLSEMVNSFDVDVIMTPLINARVDDRDNSIFKKINEHYLNMSKKLKSQNHENAEKIYNIMTLYYALNIAMISDANVYQKRTFKNPYEHPNFIVSTIKPQ